MKYTIILSTAIILFVNIAHAQKCTIQVQILDDKYMFGQAEKLNEGQPVKKMEVHFTNEFMEVIMSIDGQNYQIKVVNENCQAYCTREKRVRQLNSGDEKLVRNLFKDKQDDILKQIKSCKL